MCSQLLDPHDRDSPFSDYLVDLVEQAPSDWFAFKVAWKQAYRVTERLRRERDAAVTFDLRTVFRTCAISILFTMIS